MLKLSKRVVSLLLVGIMVCSMSVVSLAAGTTTKTVDGVKVTGSTSSSGKTVSGSTTRTTVGLSSVEVDYIYKPTGSMTLKEDTLYASSGGYSSSVSKTITSAEGFYSVKGTHTATLSNGLITLYT